MSGPTGAVQNITAVAGFAYGVIGADLHVFSDGSPLYLLEEHQPSAVSDQAWLRQLPSRMLNARAQVVAFTGRHQELRDLNEWLTSEPRLAVRWLHAPGGQGKTRLAAHLAETAVEQRWKVVTAIPGVGAARPSPGSQDLRLDGHRGVLLIVDYADRWTNSALTFLLRNSLLYQLLPTRVLLLGRTATSWFALRAALADPQIHADTSAKALTPIVHSDGRQQMFNAARDSFAALYNVPDPAVVAAPTSLEHPNFGLTLALHVAALVAVDAHASGGQPPSDPHKLTSYLLDREHLHWEQLYEQRVKGLDYQTPPSVMARTAFTAVLTGPISAGDGEALLDEMETELSAARIITDHTRCYPANDPAKPTVLEPLHPDRLAEDYLAITLTGTTEQPPQAWAAPRLQHTLALDTADQRRASIIARSVTFLTAAAARWPQPGPEYLYPLLRAHPQLALVAGGATLVTLATIPHIDLAVLEAIEPLLPVDRDVDLDIATAAITTTLTRCRLAATTEPVDQARLHDNHAWRLANAGQHEQALSPAKEAAAIYRQLAEVAPATYLADLAVSLARLGIRLLEVGRREEALATAEEATGIYRRLAETNSAHLPDLAAALNNLGILLSQVGRNEDALPPAEEAVAIHRRQAELNPTAYLADLAISMVNLGSRLSEVGRRDEALAMAEAANNVYRHLVEANPAVHLPDLAMSLNNLGGFLAEVGRVEEALPRVEEAVVIHRRLVERNRAAHLPDLAMSLSNLGCLLPEVGRREEALATAEEATDIYRQLAEAAPAAHLPDLAGALSNLGIRLSEVGRGEEALATAEEATDIYRQLAEAAPAAHLPDLAGALNNLSTWLSNVDRYEESLPLAEEAVAILRGLVEKNRTAHLPGLAMSLTNLGIRLSQVGQLDEALPPTQEAREVYRQLAETAPAAHLPGLAMSLTSLGVHLSQIGRAEEALATAEEATDIYRQLAEAAPAAHMHNVGISLNNLSKRLAQVGRGEEALATAEKTVDIYRRLAETNPAVHLPDLAAALNHLGGLLTTARHREAALATMEEATDIYRQLAEAAPAAHLPDLAWSLSTYALVCLVVNGDLAKALSAVSEATNLYGALAEQSPQLFIDELFSTYQTLVGVLDGLGRTSEADELRQQLERAGY